MSGFGHIAKIVVVLTLGALLAACARQQALETITVTPPPSIQRLDFSGHWEMDYTRSDDLNQKLTDVFRQMNRAAEGTANASRSVMAAGGRNVVAVARMTDMITRPEILEIIQDAASIEVQRENDFALTCDFYSGASQRIESPFGTELCGWDGDQMIFYLALPDGMNVHHRMTMSSDRENLHVATTVTSGGSTFSMSRFYVRFEPLPTAYKCEDTFSRKRVCSAQPPD